MMFDERGVRTKGWGFMFIFSPYFDGQVNQV